MNILIACEFSGRVRDAFRARGHNAWSCDLLPCDSDSKYHYQMDILKLLSVDCFFKNNPYTEDITLLPKWDLIIAHPPCTYLAVAGASWFYHPDDKHLPKQKRRPHPRYPNRRADQQKAFEFFMKLYNAPIEKVCVENPVGVVSTKFRKPNQIIHPYMFGHEASKATYLWLKNLPKLHPTNVVGKGEFKTTKSGKRGAAWNWWLPPSKDRWKIRSITFQGIADAMAEQWG